ncbi:MATE family efflux transporter [Romboutsia sp. Marseille-P6047]|uniref:MATE family efflux transporter n=1 Tax=Romboutsia sp. Marseille-P6047 TaxID=2161817 RepID=UPI000F05BCE8|nr:MATE family efflux transporter [Romboutsia sp. Marseille-P6047]
MENQKLLREERVGKLLLRYSVPAILAMMVTSLYNTVDRAFIGSMPNVGALAISGLGVTMPMFTIMGAFAVAISVGGSTNISIKLGENNKEEAERILGSTFALELFVGVLISILSIFFLDKVLYIFGASEHTIKYAREYMSVICSGAVYNLPGFSLNGAIRAEGNPKLGAKMMISTCILNLILDPIFIFGFGFGIKGAAIGTIICQLFVFIWACYYFTKGKSTLKLRLKNIRLDKKIVRTIVVIGLTPFAMELAAGSIHLVTNKVLKIYGGDLAIGAMTAVTSVLLMFLMPIFGLSQGMQTIIAYNYGAKQYDRAKKTLGLALIISSIILTLGLIAVKLVPELFVGIFTNDSELMKLAVKGINLNLTTLPLIGVSILGPVYFQSIGKAKLSMLLTLLRQVILLIPIIYIIPKLFGLNGVWISQPISDIGAMIIVGIFLIKEFKKEKIKSCA